MQTSGNKTCQWHFLFVFLLQDIAFNETHKSEGIDLQFQYAICRNVIASCQ